MDFSDYWFKQGERWRERQRKLKASKIGKIPTKLDFDGFIKCIYFSAEIF